MEMLVTVIVLIALIAPGHGTEDSYNIYTVSSDIIDEIGKDIFFEIIRPPELQYTYRVRPTSNFGTTFNDSFSGKNIPLVPTIPSKCCELPTNAASLYGSVALIERGGCNFDKKTAIAEKAGAKAVIISDYLLSVENDRRSSIWKDYMYIDMDTSIDSNIDINIPAGFLLGKNGRMIMDTLRKLNLPHAVINIPVNLTFVHSNAIIRPTWVHV